MKPYLSTLLFSTITLAYLSGCGSTSEDSTIPTSVIEGISDDNYTITRGANLVLNGSASTDDKEIISYTWMIDDEIVSTKVTDEVIINLSEGPHKLCLTTADEDDKTNQTCKTINVIEPKIKTPTAVINNLPTSGWKTKCNITLDGKESTAILDRNIKTYNWYKDNTLIGTDVNQTFSFDTAQEHNISLEVVDNFNEKDKISKQVTITPIGQPTVKLTLINSMQREIFSNQTDSDVTWNPNDTTDDFLPYEGNLVFMSAEGTYDDCNLTDDNITYIWDARIYKDGHGTLIDHCFAQKPHLKDIHRDFNTTGFEYDSFGINNGDENYTSAKYIYPYPYDVAHRDSDGDAIDLAPSKEIDTPYVYIELCNGSSLDYDRLEIKLIVKDNLHDKQTVIVKTIKIEPAI